MTYLDEFSAQWKLGGTHTSLRIGAFWNVPSDFLERQGQDILLAEFRAIFKGRQEVSDCHLDLGHAKIRGKRIDIHYSDGWLISESYVLNNGLWSYCLSFTGGTDDDNHIDPGFIHLKELMGSSLKFYEPDDTTPR